MTTIISIDGFPLDCALTETHSMHAHVTEYPVESGANVADHIRSLPLEVSIEGVVSDTPLSRMRPLRDDGVKPSQAALDHLVKMFEARKPVHIVTSLKTYENMAVTSIEIPRARDKTGGLWFTVQFHQIDVIKNERIRRTDVPRAQGGGGKKGGAPPKWEPVTQGRFRPMWWRKANPAGSWFLYPRDQWEIVYFEIDPDNTGSALFFRKLANGSYNPLQFDPESTADYPGIPGVTQKACLLDMTRDRKDAEFRKKVVMRELQRREQEAAKRQRNAPKPGDPRYTPNGAPYIPKRLPGLGG